MTLHGAKATAYIKYNGNLNKLSKLLSEHLYLPDFYFKYHIIPPHQIYGCCEAMGCELWLEEIANSKDYNFKLSLETIIPVEQRNHKQFYDISPWLVNYLKKITNVDAFIVNDTTQKDTHSNNIEKALQSENPIESLRLLAIELNEKKNLKKEDIYKIFQDSLIETNKKATILEDILDMISGWYVGKNIDL